MEQLKNLKADSKGKLRNPSNKRIVLLESEYKDKESLTFN